MFQLFIYIIELFLFLHKSKVITFIVVSVADMQGSLGVTVLKNYIFRDDLIPLIPRECSHRNQLYLETKFVFPNAILKTEFPRRFSTYVRKYNINFTAKSCYYAMDQFCL